MKQSWVVRYKENVIEFKNLGFAGEELYINGILKMKTKTYFSTTRLVSTLEGGYIIATLTPKLMGYEVKIEKDKEILLKQTNTESITNIVIYAISIYIILKFALKFAFVFELLSFL